MRGNFREGLIIFKFYAILPFYAFSNPIIPFRILLFTFLILLRRYAFFNSVFNSAIRF